MKEIIKNELEKWARACGWTVITEERYVDAMMWIAKSWNVSVSELRNYYENN